VVIITKIKKPSTAIKGSLLCVREICLQHVSVSPKPAVNKFPVYVIRRPLVAIDGFFIFVIKVFA